jgi:hypothetical protein
MRRFVCSERAKTHEAMVVLEACPYHIAHLKMSRVENQAYTNAEISQDLYAYGFDNVAGHSADYSSLVLAKCFGLIFLR